MAIAPSYPSRPSGIGQVRFEQTTASPRWAGSEPVRAGYSVISCDPGMFTVGSRAPHAARAASALWRWRTDTYGTRAPGARGAESAIIARICEDFNLTPVLARAHYEQMARYFAGTARCQPSRAVAPWLSALRSHRASRSPPSARSRSASSWPPPCADKAGAHDEWAASGDPAELADLRFPCLLDSRSGEVKRSRPPVSRGRLSRSFVLAALRALHLDKPGVGAHLHHDTRGDPGGQYAGGRLLPVAPHDLGDRRIVTEPTGRQTDRHRSCYPVRILERAAVTTDTATGRMVVAATPWSRRVRSGQAGQASSSSLACLLSSASESVLALSCSALSAGAGLAVTIRASNTFATGVRTSSRRWSMS